MFKKINEFNEKNTTIYFFIVMAILISLLFVNSFSNKKKSNECVMPTNIVNDSKKYIYDVKLTRNDEIILLTIKRYGSKYNVEKTEKGKLYNYYMNYIDVYEMGLDGYYVPYKEEYIISNIDNKLLFLDYLNEISLNSTRILKNEKNCYNNDNLNINICIENDNTISLEKDDIKLLYEIRDVSNVEDFDMKIYDKVKEEKTAVSTTSKLS